MEWSWECHIFNGSLRMRIEVPRVEITEVLPLSRLVYRTTDPTLSFRSKSWRLRDGRIPRRSTCHMEME
ncbi:hypothetical protein QVD17_19101 [Tagetes erecta]|uniref:Uncharacterized protein n=1 Tax=Tagetes erecta TaxID=13708 RepID=A0AAD8KP23_TARER|nr:hypothetical protein QVD17_19101 [Tagetes erecta]